jgi:CubicO group peptidase (beta-lactamase class C family)
MEWWTSLVTASLGHFPVPGAVLTISNRSGILAQSSVGFADVARAVPMHHDHRFELGSIAKTFTAWVIVALADEGRLSLDDLAEAHLPWLDLGPLGDRITIRHLLTHTAGTVLGADALPDDLAEILNAQAFAPTQTPVSFHYSNLGYQILGQVAAACGGTTLAEQVRQRILRPLGMTETLAEVTFADRERLAVGHWPARPDQPWLPGDPLAEATWFELDAASGNIVASARDLARFSSAFLAAYRGEPLVDSSGREILSRAEFTTMTETLADGGEPCHVPEGACPVRQSRYGCGVNTERIDGGTLVTHGGGMVGYSTFWMVDLEQDVAVSVLTNANGDSYVSHLLARAGHGELRRQLAGVSDGSRPSFDPTVRGHHPACPVGRFFSDQDGSELSVTLDADDVVRVRRADEVGTVFQLTNGRWGTTVPSLRRFYFDPQPDDTWTWGPVTYGRDRPATAPAPFHHPLVGHYRTFSPWFPEFRIVSRGGVLYLAAPGGTEAPADDLALAEVEPGVWSMGSDGPERLVVVASVDGVVVSLNRDGCVYSRVFSA